jgi:hypothetical protein
LTAGRLIHGIRGQNSQGGLSNYIGNSPNRRPRRTTLRLRKQPMKSRADKNSTTAPVAGFQGPMGNIPLPEDITQR